MDPPHPVVEAKRPRAVEVATRVASAMSPTTSRVGTNCVIELITYELSGEHQ